MISYSEGEFESQTAAPQMPALGIALTLGTKEALPKSRVRSPKPQVPCLITCTDRTSSHFMEPFMHQTYMYRPFCDSLGKDELQGPTDTNLSLKMLLGKKKQASPHSKKAGKQPYLQSFLGVQNFCVQLAKFLQSVQEKKNNVLMMKVKVKGTKTKKK